MKTALAKTALGFIVMPVSAVVLFELCSTPGGAAFVSIYAAFFTTVWATS